MRMSSRTGSLMRLLARGEVGGLLYGAVVSGAALAALSAHAIETARVTISTLIVLAVYWLAHVYIHALSKQLGGSDTRLLLHGFVTSAGDEANVLLGGLPAIVVYVVVDALGATPSTAGFVALFFLVGMLCTVGYLSARRAGHTSLAVTVETAAAGFFGVLIVLMKALLH